MELIPIFLYLVALLILGLFRAERGTNIRTFVLGARRLTLPAFIATLVTTWYGGILGVGEFTYLYGVSNWFVFGMPYYIFAVIYALKIAPRIQANQQLSIPAQFSQTYGAKSVPSSGIFTLLASLPAPYILMLGFFLNVVLGWSLTVSIIVGAMLSTIYVFLGGFSAVVKTDKLQFGLMFGGFFILLLTAIMTYGGPASLPEVLPEAHLSFTGGNSILYIITWFFIAAWTFIDPGFHQRCTAAQTPETARKGILISVGFWFVFDLMTTLCGLYARALYPDIEPATSFIFMGRDLLPPVLSGLFLAALLAIIMSTVDSQTLLSSIILGHDLFGSMAKSSHAPVYLTKLSIIIVALASVVLAIAVPSIVEMWFILGNLIIPPLLLPLLGCYFPMLRMKPQLAIFNMWSAFLISAAILIIALFTNSSPLALRYLFDVPPMYWGMGWSILIYFFFRVFLYNRS